MNSRIIRRSLLSTALLAALGLPAAKAWASTPEGPEASVGSQGIGLQREATLVVERSFPTSYYPSNRVTVMVDSNPAGAMLYDVYRDTSGSIHDLILGADPTCEPRTPSVAMTQPYSYYFDQVIAWACTQQSDGVSVVRMQSIDPFGTLGPGPLAVGAANGAAQENPVVGINSSSRDGYVAWSGQVGPGYYSVFYNRFYGGMPGGSAQSLEYFPRSTSPLQPSLAADSQGGALIAWTGTQSNWPFDTAVQLAVINGQGWTPQIIVLDHDPQAAFGTAVVSQERQGQKIVAWTRDGGVFAQRIDSSNQPVGNVLTIAAIDGRVRSATRVAVDERDGFWIAWQSTGQDGDGEGIYARQYRSDGTPVDAPTRINEVTAGDELFGAIDTPYVGRLNAVWTRPDGGKHLAYERTMIGLADDDYFPVIRVNGTEAGQFVQFDVDFRHVSPGNTITPLGNWNLILQLPPNFNDPILASCSGYGTTTVSCPMSGMASTLPLRFNTLASGDYPISATMSLSFADGIPSNNTATAVLGVHDTTPDPIQFVNVENATPGALVVSAPVTLAGFDVPQQAYVSGGEYSLDGLNFASGSFTASAGQQVWLRHTAASAIDQSVYTTLTVNQVSGTFTSTTGAADSTPDPFTLGGVNYVPRGSWQVSNTITVSGINVQAPISVEGGYYSINGGYFVSDPGVVMAGQTVRVGHYASSSYSTTTSTKLTIGGAYDYFSSLTVSPDTTPDAFHFSDVTGVAVGSLQTSNAIVVAGIEAASPISVSGGSYSIDGGPFTAAPGTVNNGQSVRVQHTASSNYSATNDTRLTIGGVYDIFTSTTAAIDTTPNAFTFADVTGVAPGSVQTSNAVTITGINAPAQIYAIGGSYSIDGGAFTTASGFVNNGQSVRVQVTASTLNSSTESVSLYVGGVADTFSATTMTGDTTPDAFSFTDVTGVSLLTVQTSNTITVCGINAATPISVSGGSYSVNGGSFTSTAGTVLPGQTVRVQHTASSQFSTATNTTLTIGGVSDTYTSTTLAADTTPYAFSFSDVGGAALATSQVSGEITVGGINAPAPISVSGGSYSINGGAFTTAAGTVQNGQTVRVQHISSSQYSTATTSTLTIGGVSGTFMSVTLAADGTPDAFSFTDVGGVALSSLQTSNAIVVSGVNVTTPIFISGGSYSINGGPFTTAASMIASGSNVRVQHTASANFATATNTVLTIGGVSDTFTSTTLAADTTPNAFAFTDVAGVNRNTVVTSNTITISGINTAAPISISGGNATYSRNGGAYTAAAGSVNSGDTITLKVTSGASKGAVVNVVLTVGGVSDTWSVTTK